MKKRKAERVLRIGIASRAEMRARTLAVARGELKPSPSDPKVWFTSLESLAQVLSTKNQALLETIRRDEPQSLKELAGLSGRAESNLSRTLQTLAQYGFVRLNKAEGRRVVPEVLYDRVALDLPLDKAA
ncbi:MAG: helix-turn-helix domain-containing protein [Parvibaculum sp.]|uniref:HVO_A0114 family putative DNA-binding protein n=1 Tax=Parvibaculum sp. TaxID=2024848 RepID=UPI0019B3A1C4|nr:helix-turn-helix domain-containing protein [Parvibaculum sp.]MBC7103604.1 helix-turn-helix domain-containing protein [Parvibaculum sp.]MDZ4380186.1 helix-turn-helix domain-containing protein [Parvibaculum sp.]